MTLMEKAAHAAERKAFEKVLENFIQKGKTADAASAAQDLVDMAEKIQGSVWKKESFEVLHMIAGQPEGKWAHYVQRILDETDPYILKTFLTNAVYEGGFRGYQQAQKNAEKYGCNIPWLILMDPTSACNMHCTGCWAAEYGHKQNLTFEEMDRVLTEGAALGTHACLFTGGEPLMRKADIFRLCEKHRDIAFHAFTNGTLIDQAFCDELKRVGNFIVSVSIEGFEDANDGRRGAGHFEKALAAMELMHKNRIPFGVSICYTSKNYRVVTSDEFLDLLISKGCYFAWYFHYMPVGNDASPELLPTAADGTIAQQTEKLVGPYELHDFFLYHLLRFGSRPRKLFRMAKYAYGGRYPDDVIRHWLKTFCRRFFQQQFKRSCIPDGPKVGSVTLSPRGDWRMPSDASGSLWLAEAEAL